MLQRLSRLVVVSRLPLRTFTTTAVRRIDKMEQVDTSDRLRHLRTLMKEHKVDIYSMPYWCCSDPIAD